VAKTAKLDPTGKALTVEAWVRAEKAGGVILAQGGGSHGYVLYLKSGRPHFGVRVNQELATVSATEKIVGRWAHVAGVLTAEKQLRIYVDGKPAGRAMASGLLGTNPAEGMEIGVDEGSSVGDYAGSSAFKGLIDEVRVYHRALAPGDVRRHASSDRMASGDAAGLALSYSFEDGQTADASGGYNHGSVVGVTAAKGRIGKALRFTGRTGSNANFTVEHAWTREVPLFARAMVLADRALFIAGPPDLMDEEQTFKRIDDPGMRPGMEAQAASFAGEKGALLMAVSAGDGEEMGRWELSSPPVFDGMAVAGGRLYMTTMDGQVRCFRAEKTVARDTMNFGP
jgi:hypothetical protein